MTGSFAFVATLAQHIIVFVRGRLTDFRVQIAVKLRSHVAVVFQAFMAVNQE